MHPVIDLIQQRVEAGSKPGRRRDGQKLGLAIEGGGMRGLVTSGMGTAIEELGLLDAFDVVFGTSAGAFNGAYLVARQANYGGTIYYQDINNHKFIDLRRFFIPGKPVMSLDFLVNEVATHHKVLCCQAIIDSAIPLVILASSVRHLRPVHLRSFNTPAEIYQALLATARMPVIAGRPLPVGDDLLYDGGVFESIPFPSALKEGCTHLLVFLSRPTGVTISDPNLLSNGLSKFLLRRFPGIYDALEERRTSYPEAIAFLDEKTKSCDGPPYIFAVSPPPSAHEVPRLEKNRQKLVEGAIVGFRSVYRLFCDKPIRVHEVLHAFSPDGVNLAKTP